MKSGELSKDLGLLTRYATATPGSEPVEDWLPAFKRLEAAVQALADVRTLDGYLDKGNSYRLLPNMTDSFDRAAYWLVMETAKLTFGGATPDEARAKAAAWVRSQR